MKNKLSAMLCTLIFAMSVGGCASYGYPIGLQVSDKMIAVTGESLENPIIVWL